jgi:hypothetical protein
VEPPHPDLFSPAGTAGPRPPAEDRPHPAGDEQAHGQDTGAERDERPTENARSSGSGEVEDQHAGGREQQPHDAQQQRAVEAIAPSLSLFLPAVERGRRRAAEQEDPPSAGRG